MTLNQETKGQGRATLSPMDLKQIREAVNEVRAASPRSILADLVEEKIRALEDADPNRLFDAMQEWRIFRSMANSTID